MDERKSKTRYCTYRDSTWLVCLNALCTAVMAGAVTAVLGEWSTVLVLVLQALCFYVVLRALVVVEKLWRQTAEELRELDRGSESGEQEESGEGGESEAGSQEDS